jgi:FkbM family methyltransferase
MKELVRSFLPRTPRPARILSGPLRGAQIVTSWHDYPSAILGRTERPLLDWFRKNVQPGQTWLDVGAHYGYTAIALSRLVGNKGRVFAFEPHIATAGCLAQTRSINVLSQLYIVPMALGTSPGTTRRAMKSVRGMIDRTINDCSMNFREALEEAFFETALDPIWPGIAGDDLRVHGIKIDVQGMEIEAISGMQNLLRKWLPLLVIELHSGVSRAALLELLGSIGYDTVAMPIEWMPGEEKGALADNRSYTFKPRTGR